VSESRYYWPACADALPVNTNLLATLEAKLRYIAYAISKGGRCMLRISNHKAIAHLTRHFDYLAGAPHPLEKLATHLNNARGRPGFAERALEGCPCFSRYQCAGVLGCELDDFECHWYTASWLLGLITEPAATPPHPPQRMEGTHEGSMAPSPDHHGVATPSSSSANPPSPALQ
jgi:hypothetical protein